MPSQSSSQRPDPQLKSDSTSYRGYRTIRARLLGEIGCVPARHNLTGVVLLHGTSPFHARISAWPFHRQSSCLRIVGIEIKIRFMGIGCRGLGSGVRGASADRTAPRERHVCAFRGQPAPGRSKHVQTSLNDDFQDTYRTPSQIASRLPEQVSNICAILLLNRICCSVPNFRRLGLTLRTLMHVPMQGPFKWCIRDIKSLICLVCNMCWLRISKS